MVIIFIQKAITLLKLDQKKSFYFVKFYENNCEGAF